MTRSDTLLVNLFWPCVLDLGVCRYPGLILGLRPANERRRYIDTAYKQDQYKQNSDISRFDEHTRIHGM